MSTSNQEILIQQDDLIVSKTDTKGRITYCNQSFLTISGYTEKETLGKSHNMIRHPDMPRGVFYLLWDRLTQGQEFFGYMKNSCKNGDYYWVFANVTPSYDTNGELVGYFSVRRQPSQSALATIQPIYAEMLAVEKHAGNNKVATQASVKVLEDKLREINTDYEDFILEI